MGITKSMIRRRLCSIWNAISTLLVLLMSGAALGFVLQKPPTTVIDVSRAPLVLGMDQPSQLVVESPGSLPVEHNSPIIGDTWLMSADGTYKIPATIEFQAGTDGQRKAVMIIIPILPKGHYKITTDVLYRLNPLKTAKMEVILVHLEVV